MAINKAVLTGRLTKNPEIRKTQDGTSVCTFTLASDRNIKKDPDNKEQITADFIQCVAWRQSAEYLYRYAKKGSYVAVDGAIRTGSYTNQDGNKVYTTNVAVQHLEVVGYNNADKAETATTAPKPEPVRESPVESEKQPVQPEKQAYRQQTADSLNWGNYPDDITSDDLPF